MQFFPECEVGDADGVEEVEAVALVAVVAVPGAGAAVIGAVTGLCFNMPWLNMSTDILHTLNYSLGTNGKHQGKL